MRTIFCSLARSPSLSLSLSLFLSPSPHSTPGLTLRADKGMWQLGSRPASFPLPPKKGKKKGRKKGKKKSKRK